MHRKPRNQPVQHELARVVEQFLDDYALAPAKTLAYYRDQVGRAFLTAMTARRVLTLEQITPDVLRDWLRTESESTYMRKGHVRKTSGTTVALRRSAAGTFLNWCVEQDFIPTSPMRKVRRVPRPRPERTAYTDEEVRRLLAESRRANGWLEQRDYAILMVLIGTGCRAGGLLNMTPASFDWQRGRVELREKGEKTRWVKLGRAAAAAVKAYLKVRPVGTRWDNLWLNARNEPLVYWALNWRLQSLGQYCDPPIQPCTGHRFRHYFAVTWYRKNRDIMALKEILGHSKVETTQMYLRSLGVDYAVDNNYETPDQWL